MIALEEKHPEFKQVREDYRQFSDNLLDLAVELGVPIAMGTDTGVGPHGSNAEELALMVEGLNNTQIAGRLTVSTSTVKSHVSNILSKLGVASRTEAVTLALRSRLLP